MKQHDIYKRDQTGRYPTSSHVFMPSSNVRWAWHTPAMKCIGADIKATVLHQCCTGVAARKAHAKTFHQAAGQQFSTQTRGNGVSMPVATAQKGGMRAERARNSVQQRHINMTGLETCDRLNVHQGMGDDHIEQISTHEQWKWTHESNGLMDKNSAWDGTQRKEKAMAQLRLQHGGQQQHADPTQGTCSDVSRRTQCSRCSPGTLPTRAAPGRHSPACYQGFLEPKRPIGLKRSERLVQQDPHGYQQGSQSLSAQTSGTVFSRPRG